MIIVNYLSQTLDVDKKAFGNLASFKVLFL